MFISTGINDSPVITGKAASQMANAAFYAAKFDDDGNITHAGKGENAIGLFIATTPELVNAGDDVTVQIKDIGLWVTGDAVAAGAELTSDANGAAVTPEQGDYVTAIALEAAAAGQVIKVQIVKSGKMPGHQDEQS